MKERVKALLEQKIDEVFCTVQKEEGITNGDVDPMESIRLDEMTERMAEKIALMIEMQKEEEEE